MEMYISTMCMFTDNLTGRTYGTNSMALPMLCYRFLNGHFLIGIIYIVLFSLKYYAILAKNIFFNNVIEYVVLEVLKWIS